MASRYEPASVVMTSKKPFSSWGEVFGDDVVATSMIDLLVHHAEILSLKHSLRESATSPQAEFVATRQFS